LRIISGQAKGRKLYTPPAHQQSLIRPTADRAREAIFSILAESVKNSRVLDLFAGTGAMGIEALSRGSHSAVFVDIHGQAIQIIERNLDLCGFLDKSQVLKRDLAKGLFCLQRIAAKDKFNLIFIDPPYGKGLELTILQQLAVSELLSPEAVVILETEVKEHIPENTGTLVLTDTRKYGRAKFSFFTN
jgi:16S rRNA (guanine966-N2)-methyltransferase